MSTPRYSRDMEDRMYAYNKNDVVDAPTTTTETSEQRALDQRRREMEMKEYLDAQRHQTSMLDIGEQCCVPPQAPLQPEPFVQAQNRLHPTSNALPPAARERTPDAGALKPSEFKRLSDAEGRR